MTSIIPAGGKPDIEQAAFSCAQARAPHAGTEVDLLARLLLDRLSEAALLSRNGQITYANAAASMLLGMQADTLVGKSLSECIAFREENRKKGSYVSCATPHKEHIGKLLRPDAKPVTVKLHTWSDAEAQRGSLLLLRESLQAPAPSSDQISMEVLPWPMMRIDRKLRYLQGNSALARLLEDTVPLISGKSLAALGWPVDICNELESALARMVAEPVTQSLGFAWNFLERKRHFMVELIPECDAHQELRTVLLAIRESTCRQDDDATLRLRRTQQAYRQALAAAQARDAFFGWVSHELRTPLNGIQSWAHILETYAAASSESPLAARALQGIRTGVTQQLRLIEELLDVSRLIEGRLSLSRHAFALIPLVQSALNDMRADAQVRQIDLSCHYAMKDEQMQSDPCRVRQALHLLLSHALESSPQHGCIHLSLRRQRRQIAISVAHASPDRQDIRQQARRQNASSARHSRRDMDLLLAGRLAELLGGSLLAERSAAEGVITHTLLLPLSLAPQKQAALS